MGRGNLKVQADVSVLGLGVSLTERGALGEAGLLCVL